MPFAFHLVGHDAAIGATRLLGEPAQMVYGHGHFGLALSERLAVLHRQRSGNFVPAPFHFAGDFLQILAARFAG